MEPQQPGVGRIVHYMSYGTPGGEYLPEHRAAIITGIHQDNIVDLCVMNPTGLFFNQGVAYFDGIANDAPPKGGTWHWPERV